MIKYEIEEIPFTIPRDNFEMQQLFSTMLDSPGKKEINFANPEFLQTAMKNPQLKKHLENANYNFCDGIGLLMLINKEIGTSYGVESRYPGTDFFNYLPQNREIRIFLYGASKENNDLACEKIIDKYKNIVICGHIDGYTDESDEKIIQIINDVNPDIVIVCLGCPRQELWIEKNKEFINTKVIFGNGGAIDFWSGNIKRAPLFFINHKLEWLFRLFQDFNFKRIKRQSKIIKFLFEMHMHKYCIREIK